VPVFGLAVVVGGLVLLAVSVVGFGAVLVSRVGRVQLVTVGQTAGGLLAVATHEIAKPGEAPWWEAEEEARCSSRHFNAGAQQDAIY
jgi:hypothetical protein